MVLFSFSRLKQKHTHTQYNATKRNELERKKETSLFPKHATSYAKRKKSGKEKIENRDQQKMRYWGVAFPI